MSPVRVIDSIDITQLLDTYNKIEESIRWTSYGTQGRQTGLQFTVGDEPWTSAVGKSRGSDLACSDINPFFENTIFEEVIRKYNLKRTRLMWVNGKSCYSFHVDHTPRIHIPLITNPECYFLFEPGTLINLPINSVYWVDTRQRHTFMNCSDHKRLHLVSAVQS